jgi:hypothetical protein
LRKPWPQYRPCRPAPQADAETPPGSSILPGSWQNGIGFTRDEPPHCVSKLLKERTIFTPTLLTPGHRRGGLSGWFATHDTLQMMLKYERTILDTHRQIHFLMYTHESGSNLRFIPTEEATHGNYGASR